MQVSSTLLKTYLRRQKRAKIVWPSLLVTKYNYKNTFLVKRFATQSLYLNINGQITLIIEVHLREREVDSTLKVKTGSGRSGLND